MLSTRPLALLLCLGLTGCAGFFDKSDKAEKPAVPEINQKVTQAWLDEYEPRLREALKDSRFELERRENVLVITAPVDGSFNPDRPNMLLPVTLGPFTRVAKMLEQDPRTAVLVLGHADSSGSLEANRKLSEDRAKAVAAIFRLSGLQRDRLLLKGVGPDMPRAANDSVEGRALNRRVEMVLTPQDTLVALLVQYSNPAPASAPVPAVVVADKAAPGQTKKALAK